MWCAQHNSRNCWRHGGAGERDERRRRARLAELRQRADVLHARKQLPLIPNTAGTDYDQMKQDILLHECPEDLRRAVVVEFFGKAGRLPAPESVDLLERRASAYFQSALERRHLSTSTGRQLTQIETTAWEEV